MMEAGASVGSAKHMLYAAADLLLADISRRR